MVGRRVVTCLAVVLPALGAAAGCGANAYRRELVVVFDPSATPAQHEAALRNCTGVAPRTTPEPIVHNSYASSRVYDIRFRIDHASDHDLAQLQACLSRQPGVIGARDTGST